MAVFVAIIGVIGIFVGAATDNYSLAAIVFGCSIIYAWLQYFIAGKLAMAMTGAQEIEKKDAPELWRVVENLAITSGMPMPKVYIIDDPAPNAFATGRDHHKPGSAYVPPSLSAFLRSGPAPASGSQRQVSRPISTRPPPKHWGKNNVGGDWAPEQIEKILRDTANQKTEKQPIEQGANTRPGFPARKAGTTPHLGSKTGQKGSRCAYPVKRPV